MAARKAGWDGSFRRRAQPALLSAVILLATGAACRNPIPDVGPRFSEPTTIDGAIHIESLGLSFRLPESFELAEEPDLVFLARSMEPPAIFSIDLDDPSVVEHEPAPEETVVRAQIEGVEAVIVENAALEGLGPGLEARELLVANGDRSFTVILSAPVRELPALWDEFIGSVEIDSA